MAEFAKIYGAGDTQVLVKIDAHDGDECPEVRIYFQPAGLGVCSMALRYEDTDEGWDTAEAIFAEMTEEKARVLIGKQMDAIT